MDSLNPVETIKAVLCYLERENRYLLLLKAADKFGGGFWNAPGGKIERDETPEDAAIREVSEETGIVVQKVERKGFLEFYFGPGKQRPDWTAEVFVSNDFSGELKEGEEGRLEWFEKGKLPLTQMWEDDRHWLPLLIAGKKFLGKFWFTADSKKLLSHRIEPLNM